MFSFFMFCFFFFFNDTATTEIYTLSLHDALPISLLGELRPELAERVPDARARTALWYAIVDSDVIEFVRRGDVEGARGRIDELLGPHPLSPSPFGRGGTVYLVGAGPGDPGLITARGLELLRSAEVVVYDRLVSPALVAEAPASAERVFVGKHPNDTATRQQDINALLVDRARRGRTVIRLKGGDPFVFGRGSEECEALRAADVPFQVIPGVTSATAVPAAAGIPVTHRRVASALAGVAGHAWRGRADLDWGAPAGGPPLLAVIGPSSPARL